jgi:hypothetical protein
LPAFVFYFNDTHIYLINDEQMRHSLLHVNDKSDIMSMLSKEAKKETKKKEIKVDIPCEEWSNGENNDIYITKSCIINDEFYKLLCNGHVYNNGIKSNEKEV